MVFAATLLALLGTWQSWRVVRVRRARALNEAGSAALERGDRDAARAAFIAAHAADPGYLPACTNLGSLAGLEANPSWAVTILRDCASRFPASDVVRYNLGSALRATGNLAGAEQELRKAVELAGPGVLRAPAVNELALVLLASDRAGEAIELIEVEKPDATASVEGAVLTKTLGIALLAAGRPGEAAHRLRAALAGSLPGSFRAEAWVAQGQAFERAGQPRDAAEAFARAIAEGAGTDLATQAREGLARVQPALE
jgi:Flp pilus assembly protein TadD